MCYGVRLPRCQVPPSISAFSSTKGSQVTGGGGSVNRFQQLFLLAMNQAERQKKGSDPFSLNPSLDQ